MKKKDKIRGKDLLAIGYTETETRSLAMMIVGRKYKFESKEKKIELLQALVDNPEDYLENEHLSPIAIKLLNHRKTVIHYKFENKPYTTYGAEGIEDGAQSQMKQAMSLPIAVEGALMPDAHQGYGLPIGGVLATEKAIIPYGVGVDIGCRMCLSIFNAKGNYLDKNRAELTSILGKNTRFSREAFSDRKREDEIFEHSLFNEVPFIRSLKDKAYSQIGSSGGGNHFVEFGVVEITDSDHALNLETGQYLALLSHSGSRGFGAKIANTYTRIAKNKRELPQSVAHLSWLYLSEQEGQEYWLAMNLAGDYASACHHHIHRRISKALGIDTLKRIENHHNFAWKEKRAESRELIVHRKGATPAHKGELGIIPGSMTAPAFIVEGLGASPSINSAAHGAGRLFSRRRAKETFSKKMLKDELELKKVNLLGGGLDEAPFAYKNIHHVMRAQKNLVRSLAKFYPKIVRMADEGDAFTR